MLNESQVSELTEESAVTHFRAEMCLEDPANYTLEEKQSICAGIDAANAAINEAIKQDFQSLPTEAQAALFEMLVKDSPELKMFFSELLLD